MESITQISLLPSVTHTMNIPSHLPKILFIIVENSLCKEYTLGIVSEILPSELLVKDFKCCEEILYVH